MWCDLTEEERDDCDGLCVLWCNGKFAICAHCHEGKRGKELLEWEPRQNYTYTDNEIKAKK